MADTWRYKGGDKPEKITPLVQIPVQGLFGFLPWVNFDL